jgi:hypothetical protein
MRGVGEVYIMSIPIVSTNYGPCPALSCPAIKVCHLSWLMFVMVSFSPTLEVLDYILKQIITFTHTWCYNPAVEIIGLATLCERYKLEKSVKQVFFNTGNAQL